MLRSTLEIEAEIIEVDEMINEATEELEGFTRGGLTTINGMPAFVCQCDELSIGIDTTLINMQKRRNDLQADWLYAMAYEEEAKRRNCTPEEIVALWEGRCTYIPDYDDHSSDDARCEQNILCEVGMHIVTSPVKTQDLDL